MSAPAAVLAHASEGRMRLRLVGDAAHDKTTLAALREALVACASVRAVQTNSVSGSVLVLHEGDRAVVERYAADQGLFRIAQPAPPPRRVRRALPESELAPVPHELGAELPLHQLVWGRGRGSHGLGILTGATLLGLAGMQVFRGKFLPAGLTMVFQGLDFMSLRR